MKKGDWHLLPVPGVAPPTKYGDRRRAPVPASAYMMWCPSHHAIAAMKAEAGMVKIQAHTILPATPQRTADIFCAEPTPTMAPVMVCVVETGTPRALAMNRVMAPPVSAQKPPTGLSFVIFWPMVLTMRQPPNRVPKLIAV